MMRTEGWLNFASMPNAREKLRQLVEEYNPQVVILECSAITDIEYTAWMGLLEAEEKLAKTGIQLWLVGLNPQPFKKIHNSKLGQILGDDRMYPNLNVALSTYLAKNADFGNQQANVQNKISQ